MDSQDKTRALLKELDAIERKSQAMKHETERLRKLKDEAKKSLVMRYPDIFANAPNKNINFDTMSTTSVATQSDDSIGLDDIEVDDIGLNRNHLSKDLQDVYDTLMNFQKRDTSTQSYAFANLKTSTTTQQSKQQSSYSDNEQLSQIMANYGVKFNNDQEEQSPALPLKNHPPQHDDKEYFIPVDYETYSKWMQQKKILHEPDLMALPKDPKVLVEQGLKKTVTRPPRKETRKAVLEEIDPGDDTSQDAADLSSQETKENEVSPPIIHEVVAQVLDQEAEVLLKSLPKSSPIREATKKETVHTIVTATKSIDIADQEEDEHKTESDDEERDENFVIESDNIDDKLYSSESESPQIKPVSPPHVSAAPPPCQTKNKIISTKPKLSLSSSSSSGPNIPVAEPQVAKPLHFKSESEASEATDAPNKKKRAMDEDVSGPEMDDIDDFWN